MTGVLRRTSLLACAVALAALTAGPAFADHEFNIDHIKVYDNVNIDDTESTLFKVWDQFGSEPFLTR